MNITIQENNTDITVEGPGTTAEVRQEVVLRVEMTPAVEVQPIDQITKIIDVGTQGPAGPAGPAGTAETVEKSYVTAQALGSGRVVYVNSDGKIDYADNTTPAHYDKVIGITKQAGASGDNVTVIMFGQFTDSWYAFNVGDSIYLTTNGQLSDTPPTSGFLMKIAYAIKTDVIFIRIDRSIIVN